ncbi:PLDc superfamily domain-containing protein [Histoplasma capsulatum]|uniref:PLDc superfamily domain-containing protein n=1 Tax=Ajellomyces capsulatus TaxID=5037 RepID=A0A8A1MAA3_AJECA|nr:predicted protein [Histoplasma mississippiense (nom. inval.)]EDN07739.1 predicted protein [Histoplasma mississippiense (nom. inval.)]QSS62170.1 PLDc superfamily domain-containing protein [Histoplasma capsulatum]
MANSPYSFEKWRQHVATDPLEGHEVSSLNYSASADSAEPSFCTGTGLSILSDYICPDIETAEREVVFVTCFWATMSKSRLRLCDALRALSEKVVQKRADAPTHTTAIENIKVYICLSSVSLLQKLRHIKSTDGYVYDPTEWNKKLKLPAPDEIPGLDLTVKSIFIRPFSVMHPKFVIVDRKFVWVPSCNVSWESWYEGAFRLKGSIVEKFHKFWAEVWNPEMLRIHGVVGDVAFPATADVNLPPLKDPSTKLPGRLFKSFANIPADREIQTLFLPSSHHQNPAFRPCMCRAPRPEPRTPLNAFTKFLLANAERDIYITTPNMTANPVIQGLVRALEWGINVTIITNTNLMVTEQLATSGTTTGCCIKSLGKLHKRVLGAWAAKATDGGEESPDVKKPGKLSIREWRAARKGRDISGETAFAKSHLKLTIVDEKVVLFGSGNMDRASWFTSQEVGVALYSAEVAKEILHGVLLQDIEKYTRTVYES